MSDLMFSPNYFDLPAVYAEADRQAMIAPSIPDPEEPDEDYDPDEQEQEEDTAYDWDFENDGWDEQYDDFLYRNPPL